ncbi:hypothetical protein ACROYT_G003708 [Oculina patagonica]
MADSDILNCSDQSVVSHPGCSSSGAVVAEMFMLSTIFLGSVLGNGLILLVIQRSRRSEWTTNYFVLSLGLSNLTIPFMCVLWSMIWIMRGSWLFNNVTCKLTFFFHFLNAGVSAGLLACISLDRFYIIVHPLKFKMSRSQTKELIIFVWIFMVCSSAPALYFFKSMDGTKDGFCLPDFAALEWKVFIMLFFLIAFCAPLLFTVVMYLRITYAIITRNLHAKNYPNSFRRHAFRVPRSKIKVLRMLFLQWLVFVCCCFPYFLSLVLHSLKKISLSPSLNVSLLLLSFSNATLNVAIYALFSGDFRQGCKRVFCKPDASQAYRLTSLGRKHRIAPFEFSSDHGEGMELRLPEHKPVEKNNHGNQGRGGANGYFNTLEKQSQAWVVRSNSERQGSI